VQLLWTQIIILFSIKKFCQSQVKLATSTVGSVHSNLGVKILLFKIPRARLGVKIKIFMHPESCPKLRDPFRVDAMVKNRKEIDAVCGKFYLLTDILFSKMSTKKFLLDDKQSNIFCQLHCNVKYEKDKTALSVGGFLVHLANYADRLRCPSSTQFVSSQ